MHSKNPPSSRIYFKLLIAEHAFKNCKRKRFEWNIFFNISINNIPTLKKYIYFSFAELCIYDKSLKVLLKPKYSKKIYNLTQINVC